jgi:hypothetical protein
MLLAAPIHDTLFYLVPWWVALRPVHFVSGHLPRAIRFRELRNTGSARDPSVHRTSVANVAMAVAAIFAFNCFVLALHTIT